MKKWIIAAAAALSMGFMASSAQAQLLAGNSRGTALVLNAGGYVNFYDYGDYRTFRGARINPELQFHGSNRYGSAYTGLGAGIGVDIYPGYNRIVALGVSGRLFYDAQIISGAAFYMTPFLGATVGGAAGPDTGGLFVNPTAGLEFKLILADRILLGFRPIGFGMPVFFTNQGATVGFGYDMALSLGLTI